MPLFPNTYDYDLGTLYEGQPQESSTFLSDNVYENDIYVFDINNTSNINISLNGLETGNDADLYLYQDNNDNGILDSQDLEVSSSLNYENTDDAINHSAEAGTYFARVNNYASQDGQIDYNLDLSADITGTGSSTIAVSQDYGYSLYGHAAAVATGSISEYNTSDTYAVSVVSGEAYDITLSGLASDADLRVIQDLNHNRIVDSGEIYASSISVGTSSDTVAINDQGDYFVEVYQFTGNTDYTLQFDQAFV